MKIGILFYAYNQENFVRKGLSSIFSQAIPAGSQVELLIIDDGSSDSTLFTIKDLTDSVRRPQAISDWTITVIDRKEQGNQGQAATLKEGLSNLKSDYVFVLEGDDFWISKHHIVNLISLMADYEFISGAFASWISLDETYNLIDSRIADKPENLSQNLITFDSLLEKNTPGTLSCCGFRGETLRSILDFINDQQEIADWGINLRLAIEGPLMWHHDVSVVYRHSEDSIWRKKSSIERARFTSKALERYADHFEGAAKTKAKRRAREIIEETSTVWVVGRALRHPLRALRILLA